MCLSGAVDTGVVARARETALGPEHPDVAASLNSMGDLYNTQGRYAEAEPLFRRTLAIREKALGYGYLVT